MAVSVSFWSKFGAKRNTWGQARTALTLMWMRLCAVCKAIMRKPRLCDSVRCQCGWIW